MASGIVKWYNEKKSFGFIETEDGDELFFHKSGIQEHGHFGIQKNDRVTFDIKETNRGPQAYKIKSIQ